MLDVPKSISASEVAWKLVFKEVLQPSSVIHVVRKACPFQIGFRNPLPSFIQTHFLKAYMMVHASKGGG